ncbi:MAG TPA: VOC family protein [Fimbriimonadaceae bacterium]|nr:VOC family protein [Fimbriimonadaceae bacterium]
MHTIWCQTSDMDRSVAFYRDTLGMKTKSVSAWWTEFDLGNGTLALHPGLNGNPQPYGKVGSGWYMGIQVDDVKALKATLLGQGFVIADDFHDVPSGVVLTFADPDGNPIQAIQLGVKAADLQ